MGARLDAKLVMGFRAGWDATTSLGSPNYERVGVVHVVSLIPSGTYLSVSDETNMC